MTLPAVVTSLPTIDLGPHRESLLVTYYSFMAFGGQIGLPLVFVTVLLGGQPRRHPTFLNILLAWFLYATSSLLLLYSGNGISEHPLPIFGLCLTQAALVYGATIWSCLHNYYGMVIQLWLEFKGNRLAQNSRLMLSLLLGVPWLCFLGFFIATVDVRVFIKFITLKNSG